MPIRLRLTVAFALSMAVLLTVAGGFIYVRLGAELLRSFDTALQAEASSVAAGIGQQGTAFNAPSAAGLRSFAQILGAGGRVLEASPVTGRPVVPAAALAGIGRPAYLDLAVPGMGGTSRVLVLPETEGGQRVWVVIGASLANRDAALSALLALMLTGGLVTLAGASAAGWAVAGAALRPVERMREEAAAITAASDPRRRLPVPAGADEISRLGSTLNAMLGRLEEAIDRERRLVNDASHELRTPLAIMKAELDLAQSRPRSSQELLAAVRSASEEADRLASLAETLLVYSRVEDGRIPLHRQPTDLDELLRAACAALAARAAAAGVEVRVEPGGVTAPVDPVRLRQAIENMVRNALTHTPAGGLVRVRAVRQDMTVRVTIADTGRGFDPDMLPRAFEPFATGAPADAGADHGTGLGLAIVHAITQAHGGQAVAENRPEGGARLTLLLPVRA